MNPTPTKYYGIQSHYPKIVRTASAQKGKNIFIDVIFEELLENATFLNEAKKARRKLTRNLKKFPNLSLKYKSFLKK